MPKLFDRPHYRLARAFLLLAALTALTPAGTVAQQIHFRQIDSFLPGESAVPISPIVGEQEIQIFIRLSQVDYYLHGELVVPSSEWGQVDVQYDAAELQELVFLNIVTDSGMVALSSSAAGRQTEGGRWLVQNLPLTPSSAPDAASFRSVGFFDLASAFGTERGVDLGGRQIPLHVFLTAEPLVDPQPSGEPVIVQIASAPTRDLINSGVPSFPMVLNPPVPEPVAWIGPFLPEVLTRDGMPNVVQESHFCGPGSAANSLHWLDAENENVDLADTLEQTQDELADNMDNNNDGNWDDAQVEGKLEYIDDHGLPIEVHYTGGEMLPSPGNYTSPDGHGTARNDGAITWDWIEQELDRGQDIEIMTASHWVVLDGYLDLGGVHLLRYRDDPYQNGDDTTEAQEDDIESRRVWTYFDSDGNTNIGNGEEEVLAAVAESPTEEMVVLPPPSDDWLQTPEQPDFEFQARITPPFGPVILGARETDCIAETLCIAGALPGRPELFAKIIGPRPNGFLWVQISRFTPSGVELWVRQVGTGEVNYYSLDPVGRSSNLVCGFQDREAFQP